MKVHSRKEAMEYGRAQRHHLSRSELRKFNASARRVDPLAIIEEAAQGRVAKLLPIKFNLMADSLFAFYRGTVEIMAADLGAARHTRILTQMCGDAHIKNFGFYATPDDQVIFDVNDFDETYRGPWEWDVKRLITSIALAAREAGENKATVRETVHAFLEEYCRWTHKFALMPTLDVARHRAQGDMRRPALRAALEKAERASPADNLAKLASRTRGGWKFRKISKQLLEVSHHERKMVVKALSSYRATLLPDHQTVFDRFQMEDVAFKIVGTGSVGTRDYVALMFGQDDNDALFLQIKEENPCTYSRYLPNSGPAHNGQRVVEGQHALQVQSDILLGWCSMGGRDYLVRQMNDHKSSLEIEELGGKRLLEYACICAQLLAKGHARSGNPIVISAYLGPSTKAADSLLEFAVAYADQVEADYESFCKAWKNRTLKLPAK